MTGDDEEPNDEEEVTYYWLAQRAGISTTFAYNLRDQGKFTRRTSGKLLRSEAEAWIDERDRDWALEFKLCMRTSRRKMAMVVNQIAMLAATIDPKATVSGSGDEVWLRANALLSDTKRWEPIPVDEAEENTDNKNTGDEVKDDIDKMLDLMGREIAKQKRESAQRKDETQALHDEHVRGGVDALLANPETEKLLPKSAAEKLQVATEIAETVVKGIEDGRGGYGFVWHT